MNLNTRIIISSSDQTGAGFNSVKKGVDDLNAKVNQARNALLAFFGVSLGAGLINDLIKAADEYKLLNSAIDLSTKTQQEFNEAQVELLALSQRTGTAMADNVGLFRRIAPAVRELGSEQARAFGIIDLIAKSVRLSGTSAEAAKAGIEQFNQSMASGTLRGQEFNSVMLNTPRLAQAIADGLKVTKGELREMAEQGKLTRDSVIAALESQADALKTEFEKVPVTVEVAIVRLRTAWVEFIGKLNQGAGATTAISNAIGVLANNLELVVTVALSAAKVLALVYARNAVQGVYLYATAQLSAVAAIRAVAEAEAHESIAKLEAMRVQVLATALREKAAVAILQEARLQMALASTDKERAAAQIVLNKALAATTLRTKEAAAASLIYRNATAQTTTAVTGLSAWLERMTLAATRLPALLLRAFSGFILIDILRGISDEFNRWYTVVEHIVMKGILILTHFFSAAFLGGETGNLKRKFDELDAEYEEKFLSIGRKTTESAEHVKTSEEIKQEAFKRTQESLKASLAVTEEITARELALLEQTAEQKRAMIQASGIDDVEAQRAKKEALFQLEVELSEAKIALAKQTAITSLQLATDTYQKEIDAGRAAGKKTTDVQLEYLGQRKQILTALEQAHAQTISHLIQLEQAHRDKAIEYAGQILEVERRSSENLRELEKIGLSDAQALELDKNQLAKDMAEVRALIKSGEYEKAKGLSEKTEKLAFDVAKAEAEAAAKSGGYSSAAVEAKNKYTTAVDQTKQALSGLATQETENAKALDQKIEKEKASLASVQMQIGLINDAIAGLSKLNINTDTSQIDAAINKINSIPTEKTVVIKTVNENGAQVQMRMGGDVPGFADGGYPRRAGMLPGFGGGDRIPALLEAGEFIVRKEAVAKIGLPLMQQLNAGKWTVRPVIKRARGGLAYDEEGEHVGAVSASQIGGSGGTTLRTVLSGDSTERKKQIIAMIIDSFFYNGFTNGVGQFSGPRALQLADQQLRQNGLLKYQRRLNEILKLSVGKTADTWAKNQARFALANSLKAKLFGDIDAEGQGEKKPAHNGLKLNLPGLLPKLKIPELPPVKLPAPSLPDSARQAGRAPEAKLLQASGQASVPTVNVRFTSPGGTTVAGRFDESDMEQLFRALREAGLRSNGGHF